jgi:hypothetical protein
MPSGYDPMGGYRFSLNKSSVKNSQVVDLESGNGVLR